jgi:carbonic anhydrase
METFTSDIMGDLLSGSLKTATIDENGWHDSNAGGGTSDGKYINWLTISDNAKSVVEDVQRIRSNSMVPSEIPIYGYIYDCKTGKLVEVPEATGAGKPG